MPKFRCSKCGRFLKVSNYKVESIVLIPGVNQDHLSIGHQVSGYCLNCSMGTARVWKTKEVLNKDE